jgi:ABC-type transport system substrate-binding protein
MKFNKILLLSIAMMALMGTSTFAMAQNNANPNPVTSMTLMSPNSNAARTQWANLMANELPKAGIDVKEHVNVGWDVVGPRTFSYDAKPATGVPTYDNGGYDMFFVGLSGSLFYDPTSSYSTEGYSPAGNNFAFYNNATVDQLIKDYRTEFDATQRNEYAKQIQEIIYQDQPYIPIVNTAGLWAYQSSLDYSSKELLFLSTLNDAVGWANFSTTTDSSHPGDYVYGHSYELTEWTPFVATSYIAVQYQNPILAALFERDVNDANYAYKNVLAAADPVFSADFKDATVKIRDGATFSNGDPVTAWDVVNTYRFNMLPSLGSVQTANFAPYLDMTMNLTAGTNEVGAPTGTLNSTELAGMGSVEWVNQSAVTFHFNSPYFLAQGVMNLGIFDHKALGNYTDYDGTDLNTPAKAQEVMIGAGPFRYKTIDETNNNVQLEKVPNWWGGESNIMSDTISFKKFTKETVIAGLEAGDVDIADAQFGINKGEVENIAGVANKIVADFGTQMLVVNMKHPVFGTGVDTPLGKEDPSRAAEAARYVRQAVSHLVPRDTIVNDILEGKGTPGTSLWPDVAAGYDSSLKVYEYSVDKAIELMKMAGYTIEYPQDTGLPLADAIPMAFLAFFASLAVVYQKRRYD